MTRSLSLLLLLLALAGSAFAKFYSLELKHLEPDTVVDISRTRKPAAVNYTGILRFSMFQAHVRQQKLPTVYLEYRSTKITVPNRTPKCETTYNFRPIRTYTVKCKISLTTRDMDLLAHRVDYDRALFSLSGKLEPSNFEFFIQPQYVRIQLTDAEREKLHAKYPGLATGMPDPVDEQEEPRREDDSSSSSSSGGSGGSSSSSEEVPDLVGPEPEPDVAQGPLSRQGSQENADPYGHAIRALLLFDIQEYKRENGRLPTREKQRQMLQAIRKTME